MNAASHARDRRDSDHHRTHSGRDTVNMPKILAIAFSLCAVCVQHDAQARKNRDADAEAEATAPTIDCRLDPKKRLAVLPFGGVGKYGSYEGWDVGEALAAQLATALEQTDCFVL